MHGFESQPPPLSLFPQSWPLKPVGQVQANVYMFKPSDRSRAAAQVPPFWHGFEVHGAP